MLILFCASGSLDFERVGLVSSGWSVFFGCVVRIGDLFGLAFERWAVFASLQSAHALRLLASSGCSPVLACFGAVALLACLLWRGWPPRVAGLLACLPCLPCRLGSARLASSSLRSRDGAG